MKNDQVGFVKVTCPHCKREFEYLVFAEELRTYKVVNCEVEEGGCDEDFVIRPWVTINVEVYTLELPKVSA